MSRPVAFVVGFCPGCRAIRYRARWNGPVLCEHKRGCLDAKRQAQQMQAKT